CCGQPPVSIRPAPVLLGRADRAPGRAAGRHPVADRGQRAGGDQPVLVGTHRCRYRQLHLRLGDGWGERRLRRYGPGPPRQRWRCRTATSDVLQVNLNSVFLLSKLFGGQMCERGSGKIVNIASMLSFQGGINVTSYAVSKHAVIGLTRALANEWAPLGV